MTVERTTTLGQIADLVDGEIVGDRELTITGVAGVENAGDGDIIFVDNPKLLDAAVHGRAAAVILPPAMNPASKPAVLAANPRLAFARILELFVPEPAVPPGVSPHAVLGEAVEIGEGVAIGDFVHIGDGSRIGDGVVIHPFVEIGRDSSVGDETLIYAHVVIYPRVMIHNRVIIHSGTVIGGDGFGYVRDKQQHIKIPQLGSVVIHDDVELGVNVTIDRATLGATVIGRGTKIDNLVQIGHNVQIGQDCIVCAQTGISGSTVIEDRVVLGGQVGIGDHITIGHDTMVGAQGGVISDIPPGSFVSGYPAGPHREKMKVEAASRRVPELLKTVRELKRQLRELEADVTRLTDNSSDQ